MAKRKAHLVSLYDWRCHAAPVQFGGGRARIKMERPARLRAAIEVIEEVQREPGKRGNRMSRWRRMSSIGLMRRGRNHLYAPGLVSDLRE